MLIPSSMNRLPNVESCFNGQIVMGATVGQIASGLAQLSNVKALGEAHYQVSHSLYGFNGTGSDVGGLTQLEVLDIYKSDREYNFLYQSTPLSSRLAILFKYTAYSETYTPTVKIKLRNTSGNSYSGTTLDEGVQFDDGVHLQSNRQSTEVRQSFTGCELIAAPSSLSYDPPRPLFVPTANRGELLNIQFNITAVALSSVHIYDIYEPEVSP